MNIEEIFSQFNSKRILVVGDVMIDAYLHGTVNRLSPEAPVPIVNLKKSEDRLGGAANVALNLLSLGAQPIICSVIGDDEGADKMNNLFEELSLEASGLVRSNHRKTTVKTRIIGNHQQMLRIDDEQVNAISSDEEESLLNRIGDLVKQGVDAIILEDYNKGVLTDSLIKGIIAVAKEHGVVTTVDPKKDNFLSYQGVTMFKPNLKELKEGLKLDFDFVNDRNAFESAVSELENILRNEITFVTLSEHGVYVKENSEQSYIPAHIRNIADVSGAGDTVISVATLCLVSGASSAVAASIANISGGLVCEESGVVPINKEKLLKEVLKVGV